MKFYSKYTFLHWRKWFQIVVCNMTAVLSCPHGPLARYVKLRVAHAPGMPGTFSPSSRVSDPDMHHGTCVTHVPWCMSGSLTSGFLWSRWRGKTFPAFPAHAQPAMLLSGKRPMCQVMGLCHYAKTLVFFIRRNFSVTDLLIRGDDLSISGCALLLLQNFVTWKWWSPFWRRHFQIHLLLWKCLRTLVWF